MSKTNRKPRTPRKDLLPRTVVNVAEIGPRAFALYLFALAVECLFLLVTVLT